MLGLVRSVIDRVKAMFTLDAMLDLEQQFLTRQAERKAELFRSADRYQQEGLAAIAADLRRQAGALSEQRPLHSVLPFLDSGQEDRPTVPGRLTDAQASRRQPSNSIAATSSRKKGHE